MKKNVHFLIFFVFRFLFLHHFNMIFVTDSNGFVPKDKYKEENK